MLLRRVVVSLTAVVAVATLFACKKADPTPTETALSNRSGGEVAPAGAPGGAAPAEDPNKPDTSFQLVTHQPAPAAAGTETTAHFVISPGPGYKMNKDYPTKLTVEPPAGVTVPKAVLEPADAEAFTEKELKFAVKLTAAQKGEFTVPATVKFAVCTESTCDPKKRKVALTVKAE